jgi:NAD(P)-dependent dehydrogenase (short-subunit alcohol dehydrogenase family)
MDKKQKTIVITGATSGIGLATARMFYQAGDRVICIARDGEKSEELLEMYKADVSDEAKMAEIFADIGAKYESIDILINNAGYGLSGATELISVEAARAIFDVNVIGKFIGTKYALPLMKSGAKIFNIASSMAVHPVPFRALYGASKAAVRAISLAQRMELRQAGIDVCCILPGDVKTNFTKTRIKDFATNERYGKRIQRAAGDLDGKEHKRMPPEAVARAIVKQANRKRTKPQVIVGRKHKVLYRLTTLFPISVYLKACEKKTGGGNLLD